LVSTAGALCVAHGHRRLAVQLVLAAALPIALMGLVSEAHGASFLPTAIWLKSNLGGYHDPQRRWRLVWVCMDRRYIVVPAMRAALGVFALRRGRARRAGDERVCTPFFVVAVTALQAQFGAVGWFYRYEAYCVVLAILAVVLALRERPLRSTRPRATLAA